MKYVPAAAFCLMGDKTTLSDRLILKSPDALD